MKNLVSIIIPTYNYGHLIEQTINSCLEQTYKNIEIIVIDDGSTDNTKQICLPYINENKIKYIYQENKGLSGARNTGIKNSTGDFLQFLDSDDLIHKTKIKRQFDFLINNPEIFGVYCKTTYFKKDINEFIINKNLKYYRGNLLKYLIYGNFIPVNSMLIRKNNFYFDDQLLSLEDLDYWLKLSLSGSKFDFIDEILCFVRLHNTNMTKYTYRMTKYGIDVLNKLENQDKYKADIYFAKFTLFLVIKDYKFSFYYLFKAIKLNNKYLFKGFLYILKYCIKIILKYIFKKDLFNIYS